jgi:hypothetical protein
MTPEEKLTRRANDAKMLLNHPLMREALSEMKETCFYNIETSRHDQEQEREDLYYMLRCISAFEAKFKQYIKDGTVTLHNLNIKKIVR